MTGNYKPGDVDYLSPTFMNVHEIEAVKHSIMFNVNFYTPANQHCKNYELVFLGDLAADQSLSCRFELPIPERPAPTIDGFVWWDVRAVADQGIGMTQEQTRRVFEKFYRANGADSAIKGTGLGMTIVKAIVETHGGRVWVESERGKGTTAHFTLPVA